MTREERYINGGGYDCPVCSSDNLGGGGLESRDGALVQDAHCRDCEAEWVDVYKLESIAHLTWSKVPLT